MPVTHRQRQVYEFISRFMEAQKQPPTIAEIGKHFKMSSSASVHAILSALEREGLIKRIPNVSRGIEVVKQEKHPGRRHHYRLFSTDGREWPGRSCTHRRQLCDSEKVLSRARLYPARARQSPVQTDLHQDN